MTPADAPQLSSADREYVQRGRELLAKMRGIAAGGGKDHAVSYSQARHDELNVVMTQLLAFAIETSDRLKALESKGAKARKPKGKRRDD